MALLPLCCAFAAFLLDSLDGGSALCKTSTYMQYTQASRGIRTHDPSIRLGEDSSCLQQRGHSDRQHVIFSY
jgi:hypothetical protein